EKQHLRDFRGASGDPAEAEQSSDKRYDKEHHGVMQHDRPFRMTIDCPYWADGLQPASRPTSAKEDARLVPVERRHPARSRTPDEPASGGASSFQSGRRRQRRG